jgi:hypothetical protein
MTNEKQNREREDLPDVNEGPTLNHNLKFCRAVGMPLYTNTVENRVSSIENDRKRLYNIVNRCSLIHRLETLDLCKKKKFDFTTDFDESTRRKHFSYSQMSVDDLNCIDCTGVWGQHCLEDLRGTIFQDSLNVDVFEKNQKEDSNDLQGDSNDTQKAKKYHYEPGKTSVYCLNDAEKAELKAAHKKKTNNGTDASDRVTDVNFLNPFLLPYKTHDVPKDEAFRIIFAFVYERLTNYQNPRYRTGWPFVSNYIVKQNRNAVYDIREMRPTSQNLKVPQPTGSIRPAVPLRQIAAQRQRADPLAPVTMPSHVRLAVPHLQGFTDDPNSAITLPPGLITPPPGLGFPPGITHPTIDNFPEHLALQWNQHRIGAQKEPFGSQNGSE